MKILLLEDDFTLSKEIKQFLLSRDFQCDAVYDGTLFIKQSRLGKYDLYILDVNVPGMNGINVCKNIRETDKDTPILMLTAYGEIDDKLMAFDCGADDYLVKPFHFDELYARISALHRRKIKQVEEEKIQIADLEISTADATVKRGHIKILLTPKEFKLLLYLARAKGKNISKVDIAEEIWGANVETSNNTIEVYINFLRKKIDKDFEVKLIHTRPGFGYSLKAE